MKKLCYILVTCIALSLMMVACRDKGPSEGRVYRIGVMHSYDSLMPCYKEFDATLAEEFRKAGLNAEFINFYLNMESLQLDSVLILQNMEALEQLGIDMLITEGNTAAYHSMQIHKVYGSHWPDVLCGLSVTNWPLLRSDPNIYAWYYSPDYRRIAMDAAQITGSKRLLIELDHAELDSMLRHDLHQAFASAPFIDNIDLCQPIPLTDEELQRVCADSIMVLSVSYENVDSNYIRGVTPREDPYETMRKLLYVGYKGAQLDVKRDKFGVEPITESGLPQFTCLPYDFGTEHRFVAGYFPPMADQARDAASTAIRILKGDTTGLMLYNQHTSRAFMDFVAMQTRGLHYSEYADRFEIINVPYFIEHPALSRVLMIGAILLLTLIIHGIGFVFYLRKRKTQSASEQNLNLTSLSLTGREYLLMRCPDGVHIELSRMNSEYNLHADRMAVEDFCSMMHSDFAAQRRRFMASLEVAGYYFVDLRLSFDDGQTYGWWRARYIVESDSKGYSMQGVLMDISQEKQREVDYQNALEEVEAMKGKENFLNRMDHEIRTPLNAVVGISHILADGGLELSKDEFDQLFRRMRHSSDQLADLVQDILTYSRIGSGRMKYTMQVVAVDELMDTLAEIYGSRFLSTELFDENAMNKAGRVTFQYIKGVDGLLIKVDSEIVRQVFKHLISNSLKFTEQGTIYIGWNHLVQSNEVELYVQDTGMGIAADRQKDLWKPFFKQDSFHAGLGLGLSIVHSLSTAMGARLSIDSCPGRGSRFSIIFPLEWGGVKQSPDESSRTSEVTF